MGDRSEVPLAGFVFVAGIPHRVWVVRERGANGRFHDRREVRPVPSYGSVEEAERALNKGDEHG